MNIVARGIYKKGRITLIENLPVEEGQEVLVIASPSDKTQIDLAALLLQQEALREIWDNPEDDLYGEI